ncbi:hypothetical protein GOY07_01035 [Wolbachia endosymbiont of Litomosoides sigmodontis]|uniref:hypothetical protein n=1 Tax=Wolbachia endosymbiont of Litomosoides sigmodontis TaxID=80850 RepID=UPI00158DF329|nr:hypothetical protein [Wolbachia endosymbiont of Litomosoides sigmodontis]QKX02812.1 hypothetical protein GOY07_01035 [Wolbachia endosymbiont of Litomosoides sigmodontis]
MKYAYVAKKTKCCNRSKKYSIIAVTKICCISRTALTALNQNQSEQTGVWTQEKA